VKNGPLGEASTTFMLEGRWRERHLPSWNIENVKKKPVGMEEKNSDYGHGQDHGTDLDYKWVSGAHPLRLESAPPQR
jgi:hypothetical protein